MSLYTSSNAQETKEILEKAFYLLQGQSNDVLKPPNKNVVKLEIMRVPEEGWTARYLFHKSIIYWTFRYSTGIRHRKVYLRPSLHNLTGFEHWGNFIDIVQTVIYIRRSWA